MYIVVSEPHVCPVRPSNSTFTSAAESISSLCKNVSCSLHPPKLAQRVSQDSLSALARQQPLSGGRGGGCGGEGE